MKIDKNTIIHDILQAKAGSAAVFKKHKMGCPTCQGAHQESVLMGALNHGVDPGVLVDELDKAPAK